MRTYLECIPCFFKQALDASKMAGADKKTQKDILVKLASFIQSCSLYATPPEIGRFIYGQVRAMTRRDDPYALIKAKSNKQALRLYPILQSKIARARDRLFMAVELAIAGNIIDYGVKNSLNVDEELKKILREESRVIGKEGKSFFTDSFLIDIQSGKYPAKNSHRKEKAVLPSSVKILKKKASNYAAFKSVLHRAKTILYLADNAGETVFDRVLIEEIMRLYPAKKIIYAVKEKPIINDALRKDAYACGINTIAEVVSSGSDAPGTVLSLCSRDFLRKFKNADMVISKGQGNFEALTGTRRPVFFLFMAKCPVVARHMRCQIGSIILRYNRAKRCR